MSRVGHGLVCRWCSITRCGVLSLGVHISIEHSKKQLEFAQMICDGKIFSFRCGDYHKARNRDRRVAGSIAKLKSADVRYCKTSKSNYNMPREFQFITIKTK